MPRLLQGGVKGRWTSMTITSKFSDDSCPKCNTPTVTMLPGRDVEMVQVQCSNCNHFWWRTNPLYVSELKEPKTASRSMMREARSH